MARCGFWLGLLQVLIAFIISFAVALVIFKTTYYGLSLFLFIAVTILAYGLLLAGVINLQRWAVFYGIILNMIYVVMMVVGLINGLIGPFYYVPFTAVVLIYFLLILCHNSLDQY